MKRGVMKDRVQVLNPVTKKWVKIDTTTGSIIGYKGDKEPYKRVRIKRARGQCESMSSK